MPGHWDGYIDAAHRKISIAAFHCVQLKHALANCSPPHDGRPDIPVQAFFEGAVVAAVSAIDQIAQAANSALGWGWAPAIYLMARPSRSRNVHLSSRFGASSLLAGIFVGSAPEWFTTATTNHLAANSHGKLRSRTQTTLAHVTCSCMRRLRLHMRKSSGLLLENFNNRLRPRPGLQVNNSFKPTPLGGSA